jgi:uncharacterized protein
VLVARREAQLRKLADELAGTGATATVIAANLSVVDAAFRLVANLETRGLAKIDVVINSAGFGDYANFVDAEPTRISEMMRLNVVAPTELLRALLPGMIARRTGRVLMVAAAGAFAPGPGAAVFSATKSYVLSLGQALAHELRGTGVTVTTLCPGPTESGFAAASGGEKTQLYRTHFVMDPAKVARIAYLALKRGTSVSVPGFRNQTEAALSRQIPSRLKLRLIARRNAPLEDERG